MYLFLKSHLKIRNDRRDIQIERGDGKTKDWEFHANKPDMYNERGGKTLRIGGNNRSDD